MGKSSLLSMKLIKVFLIFIYFSEQKSENEENDTNGEEEEEDVSNNGDNQLISDNSDNQSSCVAHVGRKPLNGMPCSLKTLINDKILEPKDNCLSIEYMV